MLKIKKCPFCGSEDIWITPQDSYEKVHNGCINVSCTNCATDVYKFCNAETPYKRAKREVIIKWNTRIEEEEEA